MVENNQESTPRLRRATEVPMFAPMMMGMARFTVSTSRQRNKLQGIPPHFSYTEEVYIGYSYEYPSSNLGYNLLAKLVEHPSSGYH